MKKIERRLNIGGDVKLEKRGEGDAATEVFTGIGAVVYDGTPATEYELWDSTYERAVERIMPGAFANALSRPDDVRGLFNHDANQVLGRTKSGTMKLSADNNGLKYEITPGNTTVAKDVREHLDRQDVTGSSIAFVVDEERWTETKDANGKWNTLREILSLMLFDTGPVTFPAYEKTTAGLRAVGDPLEAKASLEEFRKAHPREEGAKTPPPAPDGAAKASAYAARARAVEVECREVSAATADHRDDGTMVMCPTCGVDVEPDGDGNCPDCGESLE